MQDIMSIFKICKGEFVPSHLSENIVFIHISSKVVSEQNRAKIENNSFVLKRH